MISVKLLFHNLLGQRVFAIENPMLNEGIDMSKFGAGNLFSFSPERERKYFYDTAGEKLK